MSVLKRFKNWWHERRQPRDFAKTVFLQSRSDRPERLSRVIEQNA